MTKTTNQHPTSPPAPSRTPPDDSSFTIASMAGAAFVGGTFAGVAGAVVGGIIGIAAATYASYERDKNGHD